MWVFTYAIGEAISWIYVEIAYFGLAAGVDGVEAVWSVFAEFAGDVNALVRGTRYLIAFTIFGVKRWRAIIQAINTRY